MAFPVTISGRVLNNGAPVAGASVTADCLTILGLDCATDPAVTTAADGSYTLSGDNGRYDLRVISGAAGVNSTQTRLLDATTGTTFGGVDVPVAGATTTVSGLVTDTNSGGPIAGATVTFRVDQQASYSGAALFVGSVVSDSHGFYSVSVAPGSHNVFVNRPDYEGRTEDVSVSGSATTLNPTRRLVSSYPVIVTGRVMNGGVQVAGVRPTRNCLTILGVACFSPIVLAADGSFMIYSDPAKLDLYARSSQDSGGVMSSAVSYLDVTDGASLSGIEASASTVTSVLTGVVTDSVSNAVVTGAEVSVRIPRPGSSSGGRRSSLEPLPTVRRGRPWARPSCV